MATGTSTTRDGAPDTVVTAGDALSGPAPRRVRPPRWLDLRLVLGVLLVLGSVLVGARVVTAADATVPVWAAAGDLAAGTVLTAEDLVATSVRLDDAAQAYLSTSTEPAGQVLGRAVSAGELLPRAALDPGSDLVQLALPVQAGYVPPSLARGQLVDVYAVADPAAGAGAVGGDVAPVVTGAPVQAVSGRGEGALSTATTTVQVVVAVRGDDVPDVLAAIGGRALVVVVRDATEGTPVSAGSPAAPTTAAAGADATAPSGTPGPSRSSAPSGSSAPPGSTAPSGTPGPAD